MYRKHAKRTIHTYEGLYLQMYGSLGALANVTRDSVHVYLRLFSATDYNQWRLVRSKMCTIFEPNVRRALNTNASYSFQGVFGGIFNVIKNIKETKEINKLVESSLLQTQNSEKAGSKSSKNKGKKPAAGGSKAKNKKNSKKKAGGNKTKAKGGSGDNKEKEDSTKEKERMTHVS